MSWFHHADDYYDSDGMGSYVGDEANYYDDDEESIESDSSYHCRSIISGLYASCIQYLDLSDEVWESFVTMESFQPDMEKIIVALQSNRSLEKAEITWEVLAAIGESKQGRLFRSLGNLPTLQLMSLDGGDGSRTAIPMRVLADALCNTSNGSINTLELSGFKISSRSEVEQLARGLKARVKTLARLTLENIVIDVEDNADRIS
jgi:hypothetical protein